MQYLADIILIGIQVPANTFGEKIETQYFYRDT